MKLFLGQPELHWVRQKAIKVLNILLNETYVVLISITLFQEISRSQMSDNTMFLLIKNCMPSKTAVLLLHSQDA